jgi:hypothetical protein
MEGCVSCPVLSITSRLGVADTRDKHPNPASTGARHPAASAYVPSKFTRTAVKEGSLGGWRNRTWRYHGAPSPFPLHVGPLPSLVFTPCPWAKVGAPLPRLDGAGRWSGGFCPWTASIHPSHSPLPRPPSMRHTSLSRPPFHNLPSSTSPCLATLLPYIASRYLL